MREAHYRLRLMTVTNLLGAGGATLLVEESRELVAILSTIVRRTYEGNRTDREELPNRKPRR
jgi:hypothetical protein